MRRTVIAVDGKSRAEEGGFLVIGFDQSQGDVGGPEFYGDAWEACSGA
jgi:hypothetical protein